VAIEAPHKERGIAQRQLILGDRAICTSGNYRQFFEAEGKRYAHTIDPETGIPVQHNLISATIISPDSNALFSDAWATAMLVVGPDKGPEIAEREGLIAYFIIEQEPGVYLEKFSSKWLELYPDSEIHIP
jgi:thiamine biosynthesis lipoprotein